MVLKFARRAGTDTPDPPRGGLIIVPAPCRRIHILPGVLISLLGALPVAARVPMWGNPGVEVEVRSEALRMVLDADVDLVGRSRQADRPGATGIPLASPWIYLRGVDVAATSGGDTVVAVPEDRALPALELQQLAVSRECAVSVATYPDGYVRLAVSPAASARDGACSVLGTAWSDAASGGPDSLRLAPLLESVPRSAQVEIRAQPAASRPAVLQFHPAEALQVSRIPVSWLSFETLDRGRYAESSVLEGTVGFPGVRAAGVKLGVSDTLSLDQPRGKIVDLTIGPDVHSRFSGKVSAARTPSRGSIKPTLLDQVQSSALLIAFAAIVSILAGLADLMGRRQ
jgi:hypothetical protein